MTEKADLTIKGMHCVDCARKVERGLASVDGIIKARVNFASGKLHTEYDENAISLDEIYAKIRSLGHEVLDEEMEEEDNLFTLENRAFVFMTISGIALFTGLFIRYISFIPNPMLLELSFFHDIHLSGIVFFVAMGFGGFDTARGAFNGLRNKLFVIDSLMLIGATGAVLIGEFAEGGAVMFLFSLAGLLEDYSVDRSRRSLRELVGLKPGTVTVKRGSGIEEIKSDEVKIGDIALIRPGDRIGVDGKVVSGSSTVNQAPITGESMPVSKNFGDTVFTGTINQNGRLEIEVEKEAKDSALSRIIQMVESAEEHKAETERFVDRFSKYFTPSVVVMAAFVSTVPPLLLGQSFDIWFYKALLLLIISCPCALAISTPISIVSGITSGAKHGVLFKGGAHIEKLENIDTFAFDKTGTLTEGKPAVTDVIPLNGHSRESVLSAAASLEALSKHPLGIAIIELARREKIPIHPVTDFTDRTGKGIEGVIHDERYAVGSGRLFDSPARAVLEDPDNDGTILHRLEDEAKTAVMVGQPGEIMGVIGISDRIRPDAKEMVRSLRDLGMKHLVMITGDNERIARAVAREVGIDEYHAELLPEDKVLVIEKLKRKDAASVIKATGGGVAMVGDGINDAPALVTADLGIAMGAAGSDTALEVADIALMDEELHKLPYLLSLGRRTMAIIRENILLALGVKLFFAVSVFVFPEYIKLWMAVAIGDMGVSLAVIVNALRLSRADKNVEAAFGESGAAAGANACTDACCSEEETTQEPAVGECTDACCSGDEPKQDAIAAATGCTDACCAGEEPDVTHTTPISTSKCTDPCCSGEEHMIKPPEPLISECHDPCCAGGDHAHEIKAPAATECHDSCCGGETEGKHHDHGSEHRHHPETDALEKAITSSSSKT